MNDLLDLSCRLYHRLKNHGIIFNEHDYPVVPDEMLLKEYPDEMIPYYCRHQALSNKNKTVLCSFVNDKLLYPRLFNLDRDIEVYKEYMGICGFDLSPIINWDIRLQKFNILLSQMATIYVGLAGVKILPNFRTGFWDTFPALLSYPHNSMFAVGALGCRKGYVEYNKVSLRAKLLYSMPRSLLIYGSLKSEYETILSEFGIDYKIYTDFQQTSRMRKKVA